MRQRLDEIRSDRPPELAATTGLRRSCSRSTKSSSRQTRSTAGSAPRSSTNGLPIDGDGRARHPTRRAAAGRGGFRRPDYQVSKVFQPALKAAPGSWARAARRRPAGCRPSPRCRRLRRRPGSPAQAASPAAASPRAARPAVPDSRRTRRARPGTASAPPKRASSVHLERDELHHRVQRDPVVPVTLSGWPEDQVVAGVHALSKNARAAAVAGGPA